MKLFSLKGILLTILGISIASILLMNNKKDAPASLVGEKPIATTGESQLPDSEKKNRSTLLGFTRWPPSFDIQDIDSMYKFIDTHADIITYHVTGGVPWVEAYTDTPYSKNLQDDWSYATSHSASHLKHFVAITPLADDRKSLASYYGENTNMSLPSDWKNKTLDSNNVKQAYLQYTKKAIATLHPDYLAIGIEVNIAIKNKEIWEQYLQLHKYIYTEIKKTNPSLPIFATISLAHIDGLEDGADHDTQMKEIRRLLPYCDIVAVSAYPYGFGGRTMRTIPSTFFSSIYELAGDKPIAISETGAPSKNFSSHFFSYKFDEEYQAAYIDFILHEATKHNFVFLINWAAIDFDKLVDAMPMSIGKSLAALWEYTGLQTSSGVEKKALHIWDTYREKRLIQ